MIDEDKKLQVLLRVAIELFYRSENLKNYLDQINQENRKDYKRLIQTIQNSINGIEKIIFQNLEYLPIFQENTDQEKQNINDLLYSNLGKFSKWFTTLHELLVFLPQQSVSPEIFTTLSSSFGEYYKKIKPSIILGSLFNAAEFDFLEIVKQKLPGFDDVTIDENENIVLQLAVCDKNSPLSWTVLAHEMGHAIDLDEGISDQVTSEFIKNPNTEYFEVIRSWCREFCADLIATKAFGPSPILALLSLEYCIFQLTPWIPSKTHPPTRWRLKVISDYLKEIHGEGYDSSNLLEEEMNLYNLASDYKLYRKVTNDQDFYKVKDSDNNQFKNIVISLVDQIKNKIASIQIPDFLSEKESVDRCIKRLKNRLPISSQGISRDKLRQDIEFYLNNESKSIEHFNELVSRFNELPLNIPVIIRSGFDVRLSYIKETTNHIESFTESQNFIKSMNKKFTGLDKILTYSTNASTVHQRIIDRQKEFNND